MLSINALGTGAWLTTLCGAKTVKTKGRLCRPRAVPRKLDVPQSRLPIKLAVIEQDAVAIAEVGVARHLISIS